MGSAILNGMADKITSVGDPEEAKTLMLDAINNMKNLDESCNILMNTLPDPSDTAAFDAFTAQAGPDELAMAAAMLLVGAAKNTGDPGYYIDHEFDASSPSEGLEEYATALALVAAIDYKEVDNNGPLKMLLDGLNLLPPGWDS
jgi:hypothetical protein